MPAILRQMFQDKKHFDKAINILELLIKVDKGNINNWFNLGLNYQLTQRPNEAIKCFKYVEQQMPDDEQTLISLVKLNGELETMMKQLILWKIA